MPRPHVEFIQAQALPWESVTKEHARRGAEQRLLSRDPDSGACSCLLRFPADWRLPAGQVLARDEEFYVLDGELLIGDQRYGAGDYACLPAGYERGAMRSAAGAVLLAFFEGRPVPAEAPMTQDPDAVCVEHLATGQMAWGGATEPVVAGPRVGRKQLRPDSPLGERTWILAMTGSEEEPVEVKGVERHPCVEEMYLLAGDFQMPNGLMRPGAYFWRPPMIPHGPMGTKTGFVALFRAREGRFHTHWSDRGAEVPWGAAYDPVLPTGTELEPVSEDQLRRAW